MVCNFITLFERRGSKHFLQASWTWVPTAYSKAAFCLFSLWHTAKAAPLSYPQIWRMCLSPLDPWLPGVSLQTLIIWHPFCVFIFPHYFALIFPAWPYRVASQWLRPFPGFKSFFVAACSVFLFFGIRWQFYSPNSLKQKGLLACAVEWKGMPVLFFFFFL